MHICIIGYPTRLNCRGKEGVLHSRGTHPSGAGVFCQKGAAHAAPGGWTLADCVGQARWYHPCERMTHGTLKGCGPVRGGRP